MTATTFPVPANNATTTLNGALNDSTETVVVTNGAVFPTTFPFPVTVDNEIMSCTNRVGNTLTCTRGVEGTTKASHLTAAAIKNDITGIYISTLNTAVNDIENAKGAASGLASLNASTKVVEQPASISDHLEGTPTQDLATKAPTSEWAYDHVAGADPHPGYLKESDIDNTAGGTDGYTTVPPSSNALYDHGVANTGVHGVGASTLATAATLATHAALATGVHGVGAGTIAKVADIAATKLDDLTAPDANTDLNASVTKHGLCPAGDNDATHFLSGALTWLLPASTLVSKMITITRVNDAVSGDVAYTGVGFTPTTIIVFSVCTDTYLQSAIGIVDASKVGRGLGWLRSGATLSVYYHANAFICPAVSDYCSTGVIKTYDADGFTVTWTKDTSAPSATTTLYCFCLK